MESPPLNAVGVVHEPVEDAVANIGSPILSCHLETGSCEGRIVERTASDPQNSESSAERRLLFASAPSSNAM